MSLLGRLGIVLLFTVASAKALAQDPTLRVLAWPGYADSDLVAVFEKRYKVKVEVTLVSSDEILRAKMAEHGGADYDVLAANTAEIHAYVDRGLLQPLHPESIPNTAHQLTRFRDYREFPDIVVAGQLYAIPYVWSEMGLIYDKQFPWRRTPSPACGIPSTGSACWPSIPATTTFPSPAWRWGSDPFSIKPADFPKVADKLVELRRNVLTFYSLPEEAAELFRSHHVALLFANYGRQQLKQLRDEGADVGYVIPREGALAWLDCWAVTRGARDIGLANRWIDYTLEPEVSQALAARQGLSNTLQEVATLPAGQKLIWLSRVEDDQRRAALWQRIVSGERPPLREVQ